MRYFCKEDMNGEEKRLVWSNFG